MLGVGAADVGDAGLGEAEEPRLALFDQIADGSGDLFDWHVPIDAVLVEEIDMIGLQPTERPVDGLANRPRPAVAFGADLLAAFEAEAEFRRDDDLVAPILQRPADELLVGERAIALGGVEERAAELDRPMKRRDRLAFVSRAVGLAHAHAAEADRGHLEPLAAKLAFAHSHESPSPDQATRRSQPGSEQRAPQAKSSISNISRISMTEGPGIGLGQRLAHSIASSRSLTFQIQ